MRKYTVVLPGTTDAVTHYLPIPDAGKIVQAHAVLNAAQSSVTGNSIAIGDAGATNRLLVADTKSLAAGDIAELVLNDSATDAERAQIFGGELPIAVTIKLQTAASVGLTILVDEYGISGLRP